MYTHHQVWADLDLNPWPLDLDHDIFHATEAMSDFTAKQLLLEYSLFTNIVAILRLQVV